MPARPPSISHKINYIISTHSPLGHLRHIPLNFPMATVLPPRRTAPQAALPPRMTVSIPIVAPTTVSRRNLLLTNHLLVIGVNRQFNLRTRALTPPVPLRQSTPPAVGPDNALLAYKVPPTAPPARHTTILPTALPLAVCVAETARYSSSRRIPPRSPPGATVALIPLSSRPPIQRRRVLIIAIPLPLLRVLPPLVLQPPPLTPSRPLIPYSTHQPHVQRVLRRCRKACQQLRSACHVMIASF